MATLAEAVERAKSARVAETGVPHAADAQKRRYQSALEAAGLSIHAGRLEFEARVARIGRAGFARTDVDEVCEWLVGERPNRSRANAAERTLTLRRRRCFRTEWTIVAGAQVDRLSRPVPYGVALLMAEVREAKLFDALVAVAPAQEWMRMPRAMKGPRVDPVLLGAVTVGNWVAWGAVDSFDFDWPWPPELPSATFFLAKWD